MAWAMRLPSFIRVMGDRGQQLAELYGLKLCYIKAASLGLKSPVMIGDSLSTLHTALKFSTPCMSTNRSKVLRQIARLSSKFWVSSQLAFVPSELNPADALTKPFDGMMKLNPLLRYDTPFSPVSLVALARAQPIVICPNPKSWPTHKVFLRTCHFL